MRSELVHLARHRIENRFLLATVACQIIRVLHFDSTRTEDTANRAFSDISQGRYAPGKVPDPVPLIDSLLVSPAA